MNNNLLFSFKLYLILFILLYKISYSLLLYNQFKELEIFYNSTGGNEWKWNNQIPWNFQNDPCINLWVGIECNNSNIICLNNTCGIKSIKLNEMNLKYTIPNSFEIMTDLKILSLQYNSLNGTIPNFLYKLKLLNKLILGSNQFSKSIPSSLGLLSNLEKLDLNSNYLTGTIPNELNTIEFTSKLQIFAVGNNSLQGPFPPMISKMSQLYQLTLTANSFTGTIPSSICINNKNLKFFGISINKFGGYIPSCLNELTKLSYFQFADNKFEGTLPILTKTTNLTLLQANGNKFTGEIPSQYGDLKFLVALELARNSLGGIIPTNLVKLTSLHILYLHSNLLYGPLPENIGNLKKLEFLTLYDNSLTGTIPTSIGFLTNIREIVIHTNYFHGVIPSSSVQLTKLRVLLLQNNYFTEFMEPKSTIINTKLSLPSSSNFLLPYLEHLDISNNRFQGSVSKIPFTSFPRLVTVAAVKNCFTGTLPKDICSPQSLEVLALDGLASGLTCREKIFDPLRVTNTYISHKLDGSVPYCVWNLPNLTVLHLSGNGLTGTLPSSIPSTSKLINISFEHNQMTGTLPKFLRITPYTELRLSNNKFTGSLDPNDFCPRDSIIQKVKRQILSLENNRFSGYLPSHLNLIDSLYVLQGNLWNCNDQHRLPSNDPSKSDYVCGSEQLNQSLILWCCILFIWVIVFFGFIYISYNNSPTRFQIINQLTTPTMSQSFSQQSQSQSNQFDGNNNINSNNDCYIEKINVNNNSLFYQWIHDIIRWNYFGKLQSIHILNKGLDIHLNSLKNFIALLTMIRKTYMLIGFIIVILCLPLYLTLKSKYSTHEYQYGWFFSAAFMSGVLPSILLIIVYIILNSIVGYSFVKLYPKDPTSELPYNEISNTGTGITNEIMKTTTTTTITSPSPLITTTPTPIETISAFNESSHTFFDTDIFSRNSSLVSPLKPNQLSNDNNVDEKQFLTKSQLNNNSNNNIYNIYNSLRLTKHNLYQILVYSFAIMLNIIINLSINSIYVYLLLTGSSFIIKFSSKVAISLFTLTWNMYILPYTIDSLSGLIGDTPSHFKWIYIFSLLFNNIAVPGLATAVSDASCLNELFLSSYTISAYYSYMYCSFYSTNPFQTKSECIVHVTTGISTTYHPPFYYSYSCASSILENYIPVYFISYSIISFSPLIIFILFQSPYELYKYLPKWMYQNVPYLWRSPSSYPYQIKNSLKLLKPNRVICNLLSHLAVLLTYGVASPILATAIVFSTCIVTWYNELIIGRYLEYRFQISHQQNQHEQLNYQHNHINYNNNNYNNNNNNFNPVNPLFYKVFSSHRLDNDILGGINMICKDIMYGIRTSLWTILIGSAILFSFMIFDFSGDEISWEGALWLALPTCLTPIFGYFFLQIALRQLKYKRKINEYQKITSTSDEEIDEVDI